MTTISMTVSKPTRAIASGVTGKTSAVDVWLRRFREALLCSLRSARYEASRSFFDDRFDGRVARLRDAADVLHCPTR